MFAALAFALATASASPAQGAPALRSPSDEIVVEGHDDRQRASDYIDKVLPSKFTEQFGRYDDPICPKAIGLVDPLANEVASRIGQVAKAANLDVAKGSCTPNLIVIAAADKKAMVETLRQSHAGYLRGVGQDELKRLSNSPRPFISWQVTDMIGADGFPAPGGDSMPRGGNEAYSQSEGFFLSADYPRLKTTVSPSRTRAQVKPRVLASVVIVETGALANVSTRQLADFALVRAMIPTEQRESDAPASSILGLFDRGTAAVDGPQSVTWWDLAFLKSMASTRSDHYANVQRNEMEHQMVKEVEKAPIQQR